MHRRLGVAARLVQTRRHVPSRSAFRVEFQGALGSRERLLLTAEFREGLGQAHVVQATRRGVGVVAPAREDLGEGLDLAADAVEIGQLGTPLDGQRAESAGVHVGAQRAFDLPGVVARDLAGPQPDLLTPLRLALAQHLQLALVEVERAAPVLHRLEQPLERAVRCEVVGVCLEGRGVGAAGPGGRPEPFPAQVAQTAQERRAGLGPASLGMLELPLQRPGHLLPFAQTLRCAAQPPQRAQTSRVGLEHAAVGLGRTRRGAQPLLAQVRELEPALGIARTPLEVRGQTPLELHPVALGAQPLQQRLFELARCVEALGCIVDQVAQVPKRCVEATALLVLGCELPAQLSTSLVEDRRVRIERREFGLGAARPGDQLARRPQGVTQRVQQLRVEGAGLRRFRHRAPQKRCGPLRIRQGAGVERRGLAQERHAVAALRRLRQRLEHLGSLVVAAQAAVETLQLLQHLAVPRAEAAGLLQGRDRATRCAELPLEDACLLHVQVALAQRVGGERRLLLQCAQPRSGPFRDAVHFGDACHHGRFSRPFAAQPLEPGQGGFGREVLPGDVGRLLEERGSLLRLRVAGLQEETVEDAFPLAGRLEQRAQGLPHVVAGGAEAQGLAVVGGRLEGPLRIAREQPTAAGEECGAGRGRLWPRERSVENLPDHLALVEVLGELEPALQRLGMAGIDLDDAAQMDQRVSGPRQVSREELRQLHPDGNLLGACQARELRLEQVRQRLGFAELAVQLAQRGLRLRVVGPFVEHLPVGLGGLAKRTAAAQRVGEAREPAGALRTRLAGGRGAAGTGRSDPRRSRCAGRGPPAARPPRPGDRSRRGPARAPRWRRRDRRVRRLAVAATRSRREVRWAAHCPASSRGSASRALRRSSRTRATSSCRPCASKWRIRNSPAADSPGSISRMRS